MGIRVCVEQGAKRAFASALDWPGWCRSGKTDDAALEALAAYRARYRPVAARAGLVAPDSDFTVVARAPGGSTTDFGAPGKPAPSDAAPLEAAEAARLADLVAACWAEFDEIYAGAPEHLVKGPRGGGRDREKMRAHVLGAQASYLRKLGLKHRQPDNADTAGIAAMRADLLAAPRTPSDGAAPVDRGWPQRYAARRVAWHVLDHAWEMQDKTPR